MEKRWECSLEPTTGKDLQNRAQDMVLEEVQRGWADKKNKEGLTGCRKKVRPGTWAASDASGGGNSSDPRTRRVGWGWCLIYEGVVTDMCMGSLPGKKQTVCRGELFAVLSIARQTEGEMTMYVDASYVVNGFAKGKSKVWNANSDLWRELWEVVKTRPGQLTVKKVKAHVGVTEVLAGERLQQALANEVADQLAGVAATRYAVPEHAMESIRWADAAAFNTITRASAVVHHLAANSKHTEAWEEELGVRISEEERKDICRVNRSEKAAANGHRLNFLSEKKIWVCEDCGRQSLSKTRLWEKQKCSRNLTYPEVHRSHLACLVRIGPAMVCQGCGKYFTNRPRALREPCPGRPTTQTGRLVLRRLAKGKPPHGAGVCRTKGRGGPNPGNRRSDPRSVV